KSQLKTTATPDPWALARVIAAADGYGYEWAEAAKPDADGTYTVRLIDDMPIRGRILTLEGQPVVAAKITVRTVRCFANNRLDEYVEAWKTGRVPFPSERFALTPPDRPGSIRTDKEGRFSLRGIGAERQADVLLEGDGIGTARLFVMTRETEPIVLPETAIPRGNPDRTLGATFDYLAQPSRAFWGIVRERDTQQPIARVTVQEVLNAEAKTDGTGRFELFGVRKAPRYFLEALAANSPYFNSSLRIDDQPGLDPIEVVFELARGIEAKGRVTLAGSARPNAAIVEYYPLCLNPHTQRIGPRLRKPCSSATCDEDGRYTIPVLPGPGILAYRFGPYSRATYREYMSASLSKEEVAAFYESAGLKPPPDTTDDRVLVSTGTQTWSSIAPSSYNHVELIDPAEGEASLTRNVELMPGRTLEVKVVGPDGQPMAGARVRGAGNSAFEIDKFDKAEFTVTGLNPRIERKLIVELPEQRLAAFRLLRGEQVGPLVINLGPCGVVTGRMLDAEGKPLENTLLQFGRQWSFPADFTPKTDVDGKFRVDGLVPGLPYGITLKLPGKVGMSRPAQDIVVAAGERKDLGDVRLNPRK
ncbi:MAG: hypothetical protein B7Z73_07990, partial [Planctomycetia bacterium 21-64-5]